MWANKRFVQGEENTRVQGHEESLLVEKHSMGFFGSTGNGSALNPVFRGRPKSRTELTV